MRRLSLGVMVVLAILPVSCGSEERASEKAVIERAFQAQGQAFAERDPQKVCSYYTQKAMRQARKLMGTSSCVSAVSRLLSGLGEKQRAGFEDLEVDKVTVVGTSARIDYSAPPILKRFAPKRTVELWIEVDGEWKSTAF